MADVFRYKYGETHPVTVAVDSGTVIEVGDLVYLDTDDAKPASTAALWDTDLATTQEAFHDAFIGVSLSRSRDGDTDDITVATRGTFEFAAASAAYVMGDLVGPDKDSGDALLDQTVEAVATANLAVGRIRETSGTTTTVKVDIEGTLQHGGPQAAA